MSSALRSGALVPSLLLALAVPSFAADQPVTDCGDTGAPGQLRQVIAAAAAGDRVLVPRCTITLLTGQIAVNKNLTVQGFGRALTILDGNASGRIFEVFGFGQTVTISGLTLRNGRTVGAPGGAIYAHTNVTLSISNAAITANDGGSDGGGIYHGYGSLVLTNVTMNRNRAGGSGGGIFAVNNIGGTTSVTLSNVTVADNLAATGSGGAIVNGGFSLNGPLNITRSTISGNRAGLHGGGIAWGGVLTNVTLSANAAGVTNATGIGGGLAGKYTLTNVTLAGNTAPGSNGGGVAVYLGCLLQGGLFTNTIVTGSSGGNCCGVVASDGHNLSSDATCNFNGPGDLNNTNPNLGALANNGGPTATHALLTPSPARDAGDNVRCPSTDQRGKPRPAGAGCDIGAFEWYPPIFADVPEAYPTRPWIEALYVAAVTGGCGGPPLVYCPAAAVTREQMAVFLLRARLGAAYTPPACTTATFSDVPCSTPFAAWIYDLVARGITGGCGGGMYCPTSAVTREQMAVFLLVTLEGAGYSPPACVAATFLDVPCSSPFARWIYELVARGITGGCGAGNYCPTTAVTREQMAVFLVVTFTLPF